MNSELQTPKLDLDALRSRDRAEYARMVETYSGQIYRLALRMLRNPQDAEDVLQETFIKAYRALPKFEGRAKISTWLYRIATNESLMFLRRQRPEPISIDRPTDDEEQEPLQIVDWCCLPESELISTEARTHLERSIDQLSDTLKVVFLLRDIERLSTRETAEILDLTETAVKTRLSRARLRLRELLGAYYGEL